MCAAYLVAFAALGHRWALSARLDGLRAQLRQGDLLHAALDYEVVCAHGIPGLEPFRVYEVQEPVPAVLVTGAHASVLLPCHLSPSEVRGTVSKDAGSVRIGALTVRSTSVTVRLGGRWPWPRQFLHPGGTAEKAWDDTSVGNFFHFDRCPTDSHHERHAVPRSDLLAVLLSSVG